MPPWLIKFLFTALGLAVGMLCGYFAVPLTNKFFFGHKVGKPSPHKSRYKETIPSWWVMKLYASNLKLALLSGFLAGILFTLLVQHFLGR